jgi:hypothetical protein
MTQMELIAPCRVPPKGTQCYELLMALQMGVRLTVAKALTAHACYALSQRMGDLRNEYGWPIQSRFIETNGGARVKEYWL